jgi:sRNA-binding regulator protein Hfq
MSSQIVLPVIDRVDASALAQVRSRRAPSGRLPIHLTAHTSAEESTNRQVELFYLQKQIQAQTPMVIVLEDGEELEGCIEWYDRNSFKVRGRQKKSLIFKSAVKYMYKVGEPGL